MILNKYMRHWQWPRVSITWSFRIVKCGKPCWFWCFQLVSVYGVKLAADNESKLANSLANFKLTVAHAFEKHTFV